MTKTTCQIGVAEMDITPVSSVFLYGYPHVPRHSTGVSDPLLVSALWLDDGQTSLLFLACDLIWLPRSLINNARKRVLNELNLRGVNTDRCQFMVTCTHTHSGPVTTRMISNDADPVIPDPDPAYLARVEDALVQAALTAAAHTKPGNVRFAIADGSGLGTNRRDPAGPAMPDMPVLAFHDTDTDDLLGLMVVCSMHPTVLHENSTLISGDFPGLARQQLKKNLLPPNAPLIYHMGASGNQSPRHVAQANTMDEAQRLGRVLADAIATALSNATPLQPELYAASMDIDLPLRTLPSVAEAERQAQRAKQHLVQLHGQQASRTTIRTAECDWFGAEETLTLSRAASEGRLAVAAASCMPAQIQLMRIGDVCLLGWPGEVFVEFALEVRAAYPNAHVITLANGELQGYVVTQQAVDDNTYEAGNAIFASPMSGDRMVQAGLQLLGQACHGKEAQCPAS